MVGDTGPIQIRKPSLEFTICLGHLLQFYAQWNAYISVVGNISQHSCEVCS